MNCFQQLQGRHLEMLEWFKVDEIHHTHKEDLVVDTANC